MLPVHLIISTHTTRHLETVLKGAFLLNPAPVTLSVTCDVDDPQIEDVVKSCSKQFNLCIFYTARKHHGIFRAAQVRNNGVRTLLENGHDNGLLLFTDGDMVLEPDAILKHSQLASDSDVIACERRNLSEKQTLELCNQISEGIPYQIRDLQHEEERLRKVDHKRRKHVLLKKIGLTKPGKPKVISCHFSIRFSAFMAINGFDEAYEGYGCEDDDLGRRAHKSGLKYCTGAADIKAYHLYHPSQAAGHWADNPGSKRFMESSWQPRCEQGIDNPLSQHDVTTMLITG